MKIKEGFVLKKIAGNHIAVPVGIESIKIKAMIKINESGVVIWNLLQNDVDLDILAEALVNEYSIEKERALLDVQNFIESLRSAGILHEE